VSEAVTGAVSRIITQVAKTKNRYRVGEQMPLGSIGRYRLGVRPPPKLMPAIITPFDESGGLDAQAHRHNVGVLSEQGISGFVIGGSNGEGPYLEPGERAALVAATREVAPEAFVLVGIFAESVRFALELAQEAALAGGDAVLITTPTTLVRHRPDLVERYYRALADASSIPVFLYSVPRVTAYDLAIESAITLADHHNVAGIKDSSGDIDRARALAAAPFVTFVGASAIVNEGIRSGVYGAITASSNYAAPLALVTVESAISGTTTDGQERLTTVSRAVESHGVGAVKYASQRAGLRPGTTRLPLEMPTEQVRALIDTALDAAGL